jgi:hypothetical protein
MVHEALKSNLGVIDCYSFPYGRINVIKELGDCIDSFLAEDNCFRYMQFKNGYNYQYGGRDKIRNAYNIG